MCSFLLVRTCFLLRDYNVLAKQELHSSLRENFLGAQKYATEWPFGPFLKGLGCSFTYFWGLGPSTQTSYEPLEPREGEPRQPNKARSGLLGAIGAH